MRDIGIDPELQRRRLKGPRATVGDVTFANAFEFIHKGEPMLVIATPNYRGWDHVSVSFARRCPTWAEMDHIKRRFFHPSEVVMQLHPAEDDHISFHPYTLHLWRPVDQVIPMPPKNMV